MWFKNQVISDAALFQAVACGKTGLPTTNDDVTDNLYEFLQQWYKLFPEYQLINTGMSLDEFKQIFWFCHCEPR